MKKLLIFISLILFIPNVYAETNGFGSTEFWQDNVQQNTDLLEIYNFTGNTTFTNLYYGSDNSGYIQDKFLNIYTTYGATAYTNGIGFLYHVNTKLDTDYIYSLSTFICTSGNINLSSVYLSSGSNTSTAVAGNMKYHQTTLFELNPRILNDYLDLGASKCWQATSIIVPNVGGSYALLRIRSNVNTAYNWSFVGYNLEPLGIYGGTVDSIIDNAIANSGLASAESVEEVEESISLMKDQLAQDADDINSSIQDTNSAIDEQTQQQQQNHQETMDTITDSNVDAPDDTFQDFESYLPENGVITQLITLPISLFQKVLNSINGTCSQYNLGNLLGTDLKLPCINISNYIGTTLWNVIDVLFSGLFVLVIGKKMIKTFNSFSSMEEGDVLD